MSGTPIEDDPTPAVDESPARWGERSGTADTTAVQGRLDVGLGLSDDPLAGSTLVRAWFENSTSAPVQILLWNTPIEPRLSADVFDVRRDGEPVDYLGRLVKRGEPSASDWITLEPGARRMAEVDIAEAYDLSIPGAYTVSLAPTTVAGVLQFNQATPVRVVTEPLVIRVSE